MPITCDQSMVYAQGKGKPVENAGAAAEADSEDLRANAAGRWPFQRLCGQLLLDVLHAQWEVRPTPCLVAFVKFLRVECALPVVGKRVAFVRCASCASVVETPVQQSRCSLAYGKGVGVEGFGWRV